MGSWKNYFLQVELFSDLTALAVFSFDRTVEIMNWEIKRRERFSNLFWKRLVHLATFIKISSDLIQIVAEFVYVPQFLLDLSFIVNDDRQFFWSAGWSAHDGKTQIWITHIVLPRGRSLRKTLPKPESE